MKKDCNRVFGFGFDFWIYVVGQSCKPGSGKEPCAFGNLIYRQTGYSGPGSFAFPICSGSGTHYDVLSHWDEEAGTVFIRETERGEHYFSVPWLNKDEAQDIRTISIDPAYRKDLCALLTHLINESPVRTIYLQIRCQGLEKTHLIGILTVEQINALMETDQLLGNMVYVIHHP